MVGCVIAVIMDAYDPAVMAIPTLHMFPLLGKYVLIRVMFLLT